MSRLADQLTRMDRGASRPEGVGGIPRLAVSGDSGSGWRPAVVLVMVVGVMTLSGAAIMLLSSGVALPPPSAVARRVPPPATSAAPADERFVALVGQGLQAAQEGNRVEAAGFLERALDLKPTDAETWNSLGVILVRQGETARAVDAFVRALRFNPNHAEAHRNLAVVLDRQGRSREAVPHYRAFLSLGPESEAVRDDVRRRLAEVSDSNLNTGEPR